MFDAWNIILEKSQEDTIVFVANAQDARPKLSSGREPGLHGVSAITQACQNKKQQNPPRMGSEDG